MADVCDVHGPGAKLRWRYKKTKTTDKGLTREYFHVCDTGLGQKKLVHFPLLSGRHQEPGGGILRETPRNKRDIPRIQRGSLMYKLVGWNYESLDWSEDRTI